MFEKLKLESLPNTSQIHFYNRSENMTPHRNKLQKYFADLSRVCEVEEAVEEWFLKEFFSQTSTKCLKMHVNTDRIDAIIAQFTGFTLKSCEVGGVDFSVWKLQL